MTRTLAPVTFAYLNMVSAETLQDVMITMHAQRTLLLLLLMESLALALILQFLAQLMQPSSMPTLSCSPMLIKLNGSENVTRIKDVFLVLLTLNVMITMDVPQIHVHNNIVSAFQSITLGVILYWHLNLLPTNLSQD
jgi:hypothetical protein